MFRLSDLERIKSENIKDLSHSDSLPAGSQLQNDRYEIIDLEEICDRAFIYRAYDVQKDCIVTIKEYYPRVAIGFEEQLYLVRNLESLSLEIKDVNDYKLTQYRQLIDGFIEEGKYLKKTSYRDPILKILEIFEDCNTAYVVSRYNKWPCLQDLLDSKYRFNRYELDWIANSLLNVISRFHKRHIVHRNINPRTIFIKPDELVLDSNGYCDMLQDIKAYEPDDYKCHYFAPEIMMHNGVIGTWTDVYAVGKVLIDVIISMTDEEDYFAGLKTLTDEQKECYSKATYNSIQFNHQNRMKTAYEFKRCLMYENDSDRTFKTPRTMIAMIAMIAFVGCMLFVWQYHDNTLLADDYQIIEDEEVPLGAFEFDENRCYFFLKHLKTKNNDVTLRWWKSEEVYVSHIEIIDSKKNVLTIDLDESDVALDMEAYDLPFDIYSVHLYYEWDDQVFVDTMILSIKE